MKLTESKYNSEKNIVNKFRCAQDEGMPVEYFGMCAIACATAVLPILWVTEPDYYSVCSKAVDIATRYRTCIDGVTRMACKANSERALKAAKEYTDKSTATNSFNIKIHTAIYSSYYAVWAAYGPDEDCCFYSAVGVMAAMQTTEETELNADILRIIDDYVSWDHITLLRVAHILGEFNTDKIAKVMQGLLNIPKQTRDALVRYAEVIFECDGLSEEAAFLIKDFINNKIPKQPYKLYGILDDTSR